MIKTSSNSRARLGYPMADSQIAAMVLGNDGLDAVLDAARQAELRRAAPASAVPVKPQVTQKVAL